MSPTKNPSLSLQVQIPAVEYSTGDHIPVTVILRKSPSTKVRSVHIRLMQRDSKLSPRRKLLHEKISHLVDDLLCVTYEMDLAIPRNLKLINSTEQEQEQCELFEVEVCVRTGLLKCYEVSLPVRIKKNSVKKSKRVGDFLVPVFAFK